MPKKKILFYSSGFEDYTYWQTNDKIVLKKINKLIKSIMIDGPNEDIGKPEKLLGNYTVAIVEGSLMNIGSYIR